MPIISNDIHEQDQAIEARRTQEDPIIEYIVVRQDSLTTWDETIRCAAKAVMLAQDKFEDIDIYKEWREGSYRKVVLRAKENEWNKLDEGISIRHENSIRVYLPVRKSEVARDLSKLQILSKLPEELPRKEVDPEASSLVVAVPSWLHMSLGKQIAQVGHGVMIAKELLSKQDELKEQIEDWAKAHYPVQAVSLEGHEDWYAIEEMFSCIAVTDAGLTEVEPNTQTLLVGL